MGAVKVTAFLVFLGTAILGVVLYFVSDVSLANLLSLGAGALCLFWLIVVLTVPWTLYFRARQLIREIHTSRGKGIAVSAEREPEARRIAQRLLWGALGAHLVSAVVIAVITWVSGGVVGYYFAGFYLLSTLFRPSQAYLAHLSLRLKSMLREVTHPRDDVLALIDRVTALEDKVSVLEIRTVELTETTEELKIAVASNAAAASDRDHASDRKIEALGRRFEDTISQLTDNQEVISGIKAFLRLLRTQES
ncbi:hypothetical protein [Streptomyces sp. SID3343]|uniref:hypothetical protein n=1 Tax=Streptomyces sp. SID3343 TaxID=2690260 RepID=UPI00136ECA93|nr:hypothetical protein [Streptomyces sp. SID3343]MYW03788.1 hypothetical protein [Streptomyces sp. SID3343]